MSDASSPEIPTPVGLLPVSSESVEATLAEIEKDPVGTLIEDRQTLQAENPMLYKFLTPSKTEEEIMSDPILEGAFRGWRILRRQAISLGLKLPSLTYEQVDAHVEDMSQESDKGEGAFEGFLKNKSLNILDNDPEFSTGIYRMIQYRTDRTHVNLGAHNLYDIIKGAIEKEDLENKLNQ